MKNLAKEIELVLKDAKIKPIGRIGSNKVDLKIENKRGYQLATISNKSFVSVKEKTLLKQTVY